MQIKFKSVSARPSDAICIVNEGLARTHFLHEFSIEVEDEIEDELRAKASKIPKEQISPDSIKLFAPPGYFSLYAKWCEDENSPHNHSAVVDYTEIKQSIILIVDDLIAYQLRR